MFKKKTKDVSFYSVAMGVVLSGSAIFAVGVIEWLADFIGAQEFFVYPLAKIVSGLVILALGYVILELELVRKDK